MLEDIAILTGGTVISEEVGLELKETTIDQLGTARTVTVDKENTTIVEGGGDTVRLRIELQPLRRKLKKLLPITIVRNCKRDWPSCPAA